MSDQHSILNYAEDYALLYNDRSLVDKAYLESRIGGGGASNFVFNEVPTGIIDGSNATFTTAFSFVAGTLNIFLNGISQKIVADYQVLNSNTFLLTDSPLTGETIEADYIKQ